MLADSKLPHRFWAEALSTAVYLRSQSPTKALEGITPFEAWHGSKPDVSALRIFGCCAYAHVPKTERRKLDLKTRKCVLLGYGNQQKGYRLYDATREKVIYSRDVVFNESSSMPGIQKEQKEANKYVELEIEEEPVTEESAIPNSEEIDQSEESEAQAPVIPLRRSSRIRHKPDWYGHNHGMIASDEQDPSTVEEALSTPDKSKWIDAMEREMESLHSNEVWELMEPLPNRKIVGSKWIFKQKIDADGTVKHYKARLVAQGYSQRFGLDYKETFSPVVRFESVRSVIALGEHYKLQLHQMDVSTAFLYGELSEEVFMKQPEGFTKPSEEHLVCYLKRSIYGLKQSPRCWNHALDQRLKEMGFKQTISDPCLYVSIDSEGEIFVIAVYVDDIILGGRSETKMKTVKKDLSQQFKMKDLGQLHHFLGVTISQNQSTGSIWIGQPLYTEKVLDKLGMSDSKPVRTPVNPDIKLVQCENEDNVCDQKEYQAAVGSLLYLSTKLLMLWVVLLGSVLNLLRNTGLLSRES